MVDHQLMQLGIFLLVAVALAAGVYAVAYPYISGDVANDKRRARFTESRSRRTARVASAEQSANRRKAVAETLRELEERQNAKSKLTLSLRLERAGLEITTSSFWVLSAVAGVAAAIALKLVLPGVPTIGLAAAAFVGAFGLPRWIVNFLINRRQSKFTEEFANAIDIIVRGTKSGLPLNECLGIISRESAEPIRSEFKDVVEQQRVGVPLQECFERMIARMPLNEVKFFSIVIAIQQQAGGSLAEALENLSGVLRDRKRLTGKVQALSAEAKASAYVLGSLPFCVTLLVYLTTPDYITLLWTTKHGQFMLLASGIWMLLGIMVMKKMINFKY
ncbi:MAG: type II secretion system F family protein [Pseudomonadota bacterium]